MTVQPPVVVIGAGPAGLSAAYELARHGTPVLVVEQNAVVGGLARTVEYKGFRFDIGGHRFYTQSPDVDRLWREMLGDDFLRRPRLSRIYYRGRFFQYPLRPFEAMAHLGLFTSIAVAFSYLRAALAPSRPELTLADWISNRFGRRLYRIFFATYTEKIWGRRGEDMTAAWAAQRIQDLSLGTAFWRGLVGHYGKGAPIKSLVQEFHYPRLGPGMMWDAFRLRIEQLGGRVELSARLTGVEHDGTKVLAVTLDRAGTTTRQIASEVISTIPLRHLIQALNPSLPDPILCASHRLKHRAFITVALIVGRAHLFADNWIYVHDSSVKVGRIQNYKNWSPDMVPDNARTCVGLEYFCTEGDALWTMDDRALIDLARRELAQLGLAEAGEIEDGAVVRVPDAYPVYDHGFDDAVAVARDHLARLTNLQTVGRNGMHRYNNQDHSMLTGISAAKRVLGVRADPWSVNAEPLYHEELTVGQGPGR